MHTSPANSFTWLYAYRSHRQKLFRGENENLFKKSLAMWMVLIWVVVWMLLSWQGVRELCNSFNQILPTKYIPLTWTGEGGGNGSTKKYFLFGSCWKNTIMITNLHICTYISLCTKPLYFCEWHFFLGTNLCKFERVKKIFNIHLCTFFMQKKRKKRRKCEWNCYK